MDHTLKRYDSGQSLLEIILALSVVVVVITGITFAITSSLKNATFSKNQNLATAYARQGMEILRTIRDKSWATFDSYQNTGDVVGISYFLAENSTTLDGLPSADACALPLPSCSPNVGVIFSRRVKITKNTPDCVAANNTKVRVQVKWSDKECDNAQFPFCHQVELVSCFAKNNVVPTP